MWNIFFEWIVPITLSVVLILIIVILVAHIRDSFL
jgi:hypothetical protein